MRQTAVVKRIVSPGIAELSLMRQLECGLSCKSCEGCPQKPKDEVLAMADYHIDLKPGDVVEVESNSGSAIGTAVLVYLTPCIAMVLGYLLGLWLSWNEGLCVALAFVGAFVGFLPAMLVNRALTKRGKPEFTVVQIRG